VTEDPSASGDDVRLAVSIKADRDHFLRRACPSCGRQFKTEIDQVDLQWALEAQCRRVGLDVGEDDDGRDSGERLRCPFCGHEDAGAEMHTQETVEYLKRLVHRELVLPMLHKTFSGLEDAFGGSSQSRGLFSISVEFKHTRSPLPPRPLHGPDSADFKIVEFLCCGKRIKVPDNFNDVRNCTFCGADVVLL
jgi:hypothetical protein